MFRRSLVIWRARPCQSQSGCGTVEWLSRRLYATKDDNVTIPLNDANSASHGTITTASPHTTTIDQLLAELPNASSYAQSGGRVKGPSLLALFLTPAFALHALDPDLPLRAFEKLRGSRHHEKILKTVTAVVDRVPDVSFQREGRSLGAEGMAYAYIHSLDADQESMVATQRLQIQNTASSKQLSQSIPGTVSFRIQSDMSHRPQTIDLQMPLAQTIFSTGKVSTLQSATYVPDTGNHNTLALSGEPEMLESQLIPLASSASSRVFHAYFPLLPLTMPRRIENCMGNIVRTVSSQPSVFSKEQSNDNPAPSSTSAPSQPASSELESAIQTFFTKHDLSPRPVHVWALILPSGFVPHTLNRKRGKEVFSVLESQRSDDPSYTSHPMDLQVGLRRLLTQYNARLCRVLSGGGGWGKKAGLLSLDPDVDFSGHSADASERDIDYGMLEDAAGLKHEKKSALGEIVREGEYVMFLLGPHPPEAHEEELDERQTYNHVLPKSTFTKVLADTERSIIFGALPSSIDQVSPVAQGTSTESDPVPTIVHSNKAFGVLSEGGMSASIITPPNPLKSETFETTIQTKLDVPFTNLIFAKPRPEKTQAADSRRANKNARSRPQTSSSDVKGWDRILGSWERTPQESEAGIRLRRVSDSEDEGAGLATKRHSWSPPVKGRPTRGRKWYSTSARPLGNTKQVVQMEHVKASKE